MTYGGVASPTPTSGATRVSRRSSSSATKPAPHVSQRKRQSQQDSEELQGAPGRRQELDPSAQGMKGSSVPAERQSRQTLKGREGSAEKQAGSLKGREGGLERQQGQQQPINSGQDGEMTPAMSSIAEANYVWVQCDLCNKWRELPKGHVVSYCTLLAGKCWYCLYC